MLKRKLILVYGLIFLFSISTVCYFINSYRRSHNNRIETQFHELHDIYFFNSSHGWIVGGSGYIFITHNGGEFWEKYQINTIYIFIQVQFASDQNGWILERTSGQIYKSNDGGLNWNLQTEDVPFKITSFYFINVTTGWATTSSGLILKTMDGGNQWNIQLNITPSLMLKMMPPLDFGGFKNIYFLNESHGWALYQGNTPQNPTNLVFQTDNSGNSWVNYSMPSQLYLRKIMFVDQFNGWIIGDYGPSFFTNNSGVTWNKFNLTDASLFDLHFLNESHGWICGTLGTLLHTQDGGKNWIDLSDPSNTRNFNAIFFQNESKGWVISWTDRSFVSFDGGYVWYLVQLEQPEPFYFNNSWIWLLLALDTVLIIGGTYLVYNRERIRQSRIGQNIQSILGNVANSFFNSETIKSKVFSLLSTLGLIYGFMFLFNLIHECGHAFAAFIFGGFTDHIEMGVTTAGRCWIVGSFSNFERIVISMAGFLSQLIVAIVVIGVLLFYFKKNRFLSFLAIITFLDGIILVLFYYCGIQISPTPIGGASDITHIAQRLDVPPIIICLFFIPHIVISLYIGGKLGLHFYKTHLNSNRTFLYLLLISFLIYSLGFNLIFALVPNTYGINFY
ncbi:MAG: M50 family metallopeptidase [Candidatus Helarchaeota archaeon]|nr:M50 family metallopeptidase [Candidatus Helarchaeota archaeon]